MGKALVNERDRLLAMVFAAMQHGMARTDYPGGAAKLLSDYTFACIQYGVAFDANGLRNISASQANDPEVIRFKKKLTARKL